MDFTHIRGIIMDMDGVLWRGDQRLPGVLEWFAFLRERGLPFALATNNSAKSPDDYVHKLDKMGITGIEPSQIVTSGTTTVAWLRGRYAAGTRIHVLGGDGLKRLISDAGYQLSDEADLVVVGIDIHVTYEKLKRAALLIRAGAEYIGTNGDVSIPTPEGLAPGAGSLLAAISAATGKQPTIMGKPNPPMFLAAVESLGITPPEALMIGDRLNTDVIGAHAAGLKTALVLTGVSTREEAEASDPAPDGIFEDLDSLRAMWR